MEGGVFFLMLITIVGIVGCVATLFLLIWARYKEWKDGDIQ